MTFTKEQLQAVMTGTDLNHRVEALRQLLGYPVKEHDPQGSRFWYLRPGIDELEAEETCPIAVGFYEELSGITDQEIKRFLTSKEQQQEIYGHYTNRVAEQQPVMYLLLPTKEATGRVPLVLPSEGGLRQRQIQTFDWNEPQLIARLNRLKQGELPIAAKGLSSVPLVEWVFYEPIKTAKELAQLLAEAARRIEQVIPQVYEKEKADGYLHRLLKSFQRELLPTLQLTSDNEKDYSFVDIYAQTIAYALFTAKVFSHVKDKRERREKETHFDRESAWQQLPETNPFLRKLFKDVSEREPEELGDELIGAIADIFGILRAAKMDAILSDFQLKMNREDIVIRFYEDFLTAYKPQMRERRGVYYTPEAVVSYMVRSVDILLKEKFNKPLGLADPEVMILDPACGTGTFLLWICQLIHQRFHNEREAIIERVGDISWSDYIKNHLLPRIFGFELLMAPYAIAHLKLGLFLEETGYTFDSGKRIEIYLTNSLENTPRKAETLFEEFIAEEADQAVVIKRDKPIMLMIGNPPYSVSSSNKSKFIEELMDLYKNPVRSEKNIQPLSDDYIKFIRFGHHQIERTGYGIIAYITNHSYLEGLVHRGMREEIFKTFDHIHITDLHGGSLQEVKKSDIDENVFDIRQAVAITFLCKDKSKKAEDSCLVKYHELYGYRQNKYAFLSNNSIESYVCRKINPIEPHYFFVPKNLNLASEYEKFWSLDNIFLINSTGFTTHRDHLVIDQSKDVLFKRINNFIQSEKIDIKVSEEFNVHDTSDWSINESRSKLRQLGESWKLDFYKCLYRPFDFRHIFYNSVLIDRPRNEMCHLLQSNLAIAISKVRTHPDFDAVLATEYIVETKAVESTRRSYAFPLYTYSTFANSNTNKGQKNIFQDKTVNFNNTFLNSIKSQLGYTPTPEAIFYYIYAIFHSPTYRNRYAEFLKIGFPRVPLTNNNQLFIQLATYGEELVALHLMKSPKLNKLITQFTENNGNCIVDVGHPKYTNGAVTINKKGDKFIGVLESVWNFYVGGYQVCQKWLKDRKGRTLTPDDIQHYQRIVVALKETVELMAKIDAAIPAWPIQ
ncbi:N-6 DNA methylase [Nostoc sp. XA013]|nr:N-6 DNA methylase [Nostoc sp. XA013]